MMADREVVIAHPMDSFHSTMGGGIRLLMNSLHVLVKHGYEATVLGYQIDAHPHDQEWCQISLGTGVLNWSQFMLRLYIRLPFIPLPANGLILAHRMDCILPFVIFKRSNPKILFAAAPMHYLRLRFGIFFPALRVPYQIAERICLAGVDMIVAVDETTENYYLKRYPHFARKITKLPSFIDLEAFPLIPQLEAREALGLSNDEKIVLYVGRVVPVKNIPLLIEAFAKVKNRVIQSRLLIVGEGESFISILNMVAGMKAISLTGRIPVEAVQLYLNAADVLVLCSIEEGSPLVVKEALACGLPVVSTQVGDVEDLLSLDDDLGSVVTADVNFLAEAIITWLDRSRLTTKLRHKRRSFVKRYDVSMVGPKLFKICEEVVGHYNR